MHRYIISCALILVGISLASCFAPPMGLRGLAPGPNPGGGASMSPRPSGQIALRSLAELSARGAGIVAEADPARWSTLLAQSDGDVHAIYEREEAGYATLDRELHTPDHQQQIDAALARLPPGPEGDRQRRFLADPYQHERFMLEVAVGQYWHATRRPALALENLRRAYAMIDDSAPISQRLMAMTMLATSESAVGRFTAADRVASQLREIATQTIVSRSNGVGLYNSTMPHADAANAASLLAAEAVRLAELAGDSNEVARLWTWAQPRIETADPRIRAAACFQFAHALAVAGNPAAAAKALAAGSRAASAHSQNNDARYQIGRAHV